MKVRVDGARCRGHTLCAMIASESFELDDVDGHAHAFDDVVPADQHDEVAEAARPRPEQAIQISAEQKGITL